MRRILYLFFLLAAYQAIGQQTRSYSIQKLEQAPNIDGEIESIWDQLPVASDFITSQPIFGKKPSGSTQFRMGYTDLALFILVECNSKFVRADGTQRDELGTGEWISVAFDTWNDQQNSLVFYVTASGAQTDAKHGLDGLATGFDAVWQSEVIKTSDGWLAEIRIPFVSLRFPVLEEHTWGLQVQRYNTDQGELSSWSPQDPLVSDWERQYGKLRGINGIHQKLRHQMVWYMNYDQINRDYFFTDERLFTTGVDARLGWSSNSSFDISLLPSISSVPSGINGFPSDYNHGFMELFELGGTIPAPRQFNQEQYAITGSARLTRPFIPNTAFKPLENKINPPGSFKGIEGGGKLNETTYSHQTKNGLSWTIYNSLHDALRAKYRKGSLARNQQVFEQVTSRSNFTQVTLRQTFSNNSFVEIAPHYFYGGTHFGSKGGTMKVQFRDPGNQFEFSSEQFFNRQFSPEVEMYNTLNSAYRLARINRKFTYGLEHIQINGPSGYVAGNLPEKYRASHVFAQWQEFNRGIRFQNKLVRAEWGQSPFAIVPNEDKRGRLNLLLEGLDHHFQTWGAQFSGPLRHSVVQYDEFGSNFYRKISPYIDNLLYWKSDKRKRVYGELNLNNRIYFKRENNQLAYLGKINYIPWPFLRLYAFGGQTTQFNTLQSYPSADSRILFDFYHQKTSYLGSAFYLYPTPRFTLIAELIRYRQKRSNQQVVELSANGELSDAGISPEPFESKWESASSLSFQWQMGLLSYFRFDLHNNFFYSSLNPANPFQPFLGNFNQFNASLIWFFDGPRSSYRDDPKMPRKTR
jgi:hypothetical protein